MITMNCGGSCRNIATVMTSCQVMIRSFASALAVGHLAAQARQLAEQVVIGDARA